MTQGKFQRNEKKRNSTHPATFQKGLFLKLTKKISYLKYKITFLFESMTYKILVRQNTSFFLHWIIMQVTRNTFCNLYLISLTGNLNCLFLVLPFWIYNKVFKFFHYCTEMLKLQHFLWKHKRLLVRNKKIALILKNPTKLIEAYVLRKKKNKKRENRKKPNFKSYLVMWTPLSLLLSSKNKNSFIRNENN